MGLGLSADFQKNLEYRGPGLQTPDFQKNSGVSGAPDSRFPEKIWSTRGPRLQITDSRIWSPGCRYSSFFWKSGVWSPGPGYSRFFLEIWSLESGARVLQIFSGNLESGVPPSQNPLPAAKCVDHGGGEHICIYIYIDTRIFVHISVYALSYKKQYVHTEEGTCSAEGRFTRRGRNSLRQKTGQVSVQKASMVNRKPPMKMEMECPAEYMISATHIARYLKGNLAGRDNMRSVLLHRSCPPRSKKTICQVFIRTSSCSGLCPYRCPTDESQLATPQRLYVAGNRRGCRAHGKDRSQLVQKSVCVGFVCSPPTHGESEYSCTCKACNTALTGLYLAIKESKRPDPRKFNQIPDADPCPRRVIDQQQADGNCRETT